ncbi:MAG: prepilin-type N-terminal cleavage/methylation domain-containing protein [Isosphaeraceae bacterium]
MRPEPTGIPPGTRRLRAGLSLMELMVATVVVGVLAAWSIPRLAVSVEVSKADLALANLRSIWAAERFYHAQNRSANPPYAALGVLYQQGLIDSSLFAASDPGSAASQPYCYTVAIDPRTGHWTAFAARNGSQAARGSFSLDLEAGGTVQDSVIYGGQITIVANPATWLSRTLPGVTP